MNNKSILTDWQFPTLEYLQQVSWSLQLLETSKWTLKEQFSLVAVNVYLSLPGIPSSEVRMKVWAMTPTWMWKNLRTPAIRMSRLFRARKLQLSSDISSRTDSSSLNSITIWPTTPFADSGPFNHFVNFICIKIPKLKVVPNPINMTINRSKWRMTISWQKFSHCWVECPISFQLWFDEIICCVLDHALRLDHSDHADQGN